MKWFMTECDMKFHWTFLHRYFFNFFLTKTQNTASEVNYGCECEAKLLIILNYWAFEHSHEISKYLARRWAASDLTLIQEGWREQNAGNTHHRSPSHHTTNTKTTTHIHSHILANHFKPSTHCMFLDKRREATGRRLKPVVLTVSIIYHCALLKFPKKVSGVFPRMRVSTKKMCHSFNQKPTKKIFIL